MAYHPFDVLRLADLIAGKGHIDYGGDLRHAQRAGWALCVAKSLCRVAATKTMRRFTRPRPRSTRPERPGSTGSR
jgi:hypothetical protein